MEPFVSINAHNTNYLCGFVFKKDPLENNLNKFEVLKKFKFF